MFQCIVEIRHRFTLYLMRDARIILCIMKISMRFNCSKYENHVLGIERHEYNQKINDSLLNIEEVKERLREFLGFL